MYSVQLGYLMLRLNEWFLYHRSIYLEEIFHDLTVVSVITSMTYLHPSVLCLRQMNCFFYISVIC